MKTTPIDIIQPINKVIYNDETLIDLSGDTVTEADVTEGMVFHLANGQAATGTKSNPIQFRIKWINYDRHHLDATGKYGRLEVKIEFISGRELLQDTDRIIWAKKRKVIHNAPYRRSVYKYRRCANAILAKDIPANGILIFQEDSRNLIRNNANTTLGDAQAKNAIYIIRDGSLSKDDNWQHISNMATFSYNRNVHSEKDKGNISFTIDGGI